MTSTEVAIMAPGELVGTGRLSPKLLAEQADEIREVMRSVLVPDVDYGVIPGTQKPTLYKSGAEWLLKWSRFGHTLTPVEIERDSDGRKTGVTYRATIHLLDAPTVIVATCDGYAGYDEERFYQTVEQLEAKERSLAKRYKRAPREDKWAAPYRAPYNSVLKMAEKRALVGATLQACAASSLFTQDLDDTHVDPSANPPVEDTDDPNAPFVAVGWESRAAHDEQRETLLEYLRSTLTNEAQQKAYREWRAEVGIDFGQKLSPEQMRQARDGAERVANGERPTGGGEEVGSVGLAEPAPSGASDVGEGPTGPAETLSGMDEEAHVVRQAVEHAQDSRFTKSRLRVPPVPAEGRQERVVDVDARQVENAPQATAETGETGDMEEACLACLGGSAKTLDPSCSMCEGTGFVHNGIAAAARFAAEARRRAHEPAGGALFAGDACERCGSTRTKLVDVQGVRLCERASECTKRANARAGGQVDGVDG